MYVCMHEHCVYGTFHIIQSTTIVFIAVTIGLYYIIILNSSESIQADSK